MCSLVRLAASRGPLVHRETSDAAVAHLVFVSRHVGRWRHYLRWRFDEHDVPALHQLVCFCVVDTLRRGVLAVPAEPSLPTPVLQLLGVRFDVYESPGADGPEVWQCRLFPWTALYGVPMLSAEWGVRFARYAAVNMSFAQEF